MNIANALRALIGMAESFPTELHTSHPDVIAARAALAAHDASVSAGGWRSIGSGAIELPDGRCFRMGDTATAERIVACVNACQGIADPARLVPDLKNCLGALVSSSDQLHRQLARKVMEGWS